MIWAVSRETLNEKKKKLWMNLILLLLIRKKKVYGQVVTLKIKYNQKNENNNDAIKLNQICLRAKAVAIKMGS